MTFLAKLGFFYAMTALSLFIVASIALGADVGWASFGSFTMVGAAIFGISTMGVVIIAAAVLAFGRQQ